MSAITRHFRTWEDVTNAVRPRTLADMATIPTSHDEQQVERANATGLTPVVFIHGLWLLPSSWDQWAEVFAQAGYTPVMAPWPDDPETVAEANAHPEVLANKSVGQIADYIGDLVGRLDKQPAIVGHS